MKNIILLLTLITTINLTANPFSQMRPNLKVAESQTSQKYFYAKRAAERGNARAQFDLGLMYANGNGVEKNEKLALMWFNRAAQNNFSKSPTVKKVVKTTRISQKFTFAKEAAAKVTQTAKEATKPADNSAKGKELFSKCAGCHGVDGKTKALGKSEVIAGQNADDLVKKITEYKAGNRNVAGMGQLMQGQVKSLSDEDIKALANYISNLK